MADVRYDNGAISVDGHYVERRDWGLQEKTQEVEGRTVYLGPVWREQLRVTLPKGQVLEAWCEVPEIQNENVLKLGERMGLARKKVLDKMGEEIALKLKEGS